MKTTVFILQVQGWGDSEDAFYNTGAFSSRELAEAAETRLRAEALADGLEDVVTEIESLELDQ
jgi:hypothetical protein